jgi:hypothetical protein
MTVEAILLAAMELPETDRAAIAHRLLESLPEERDQEYLTELAADIERRSQEVMSGACVGSEASESLARMEQALARRRGTCN